MNFVVFEWKKLFRLPAIWIFLLLCLLFNTAIILGKNGKEESFQSFGRLARACGQRISPAHFSFSSSLPEEERTLLLASLDAAENVFLSYDAAVLSQHYQEILSSSPVAKTWIARKYDLLQKRIDALADSGAALDLYAGAMTKERHRFLFRSLMRSILLEGIFLCIASTLYLLGYERLHGTESLLASSRLGRRHCRCKIFSALSAGLLFYLLLCAAMLGIYFSRWDYRGLWTANVSSCFNYITEAALTRPFITWTDFSLFSYLAAVLLLGGVLVLLFGLIAVVCESLMNNTYSAFILLVGFCLASVWLQSALGDCGLWMGYFLLSIHPFCLWFCMDGWFTELGLFALLPFQEVLASFCCLLLLSLLVYVSVKSYHRRDLP
ncbi:MAG: hypothetical protein Q4A78_10155 [Peptostreptococcaceae bacterium]|nr:hypothetical protein [Peptostreptococcaceae bacterium]